MFTYDEAVQRVYSFIRTDQSLDEKARRPQRMRALLDLLGQPDQAYPIVHVAGTKGKGSTCAFCSAILQAHGQRIGLYTSPHLQNLRERIQLDSRLISTDEFTTCMNLISPYFDAVEGLGFPEIMLAIALTYFQRAGVQTAIIETHLGGRLDATNALTPIVSVITPIGYDHMEVLGASLAEIAGHKAGIIKAEIPVVSARQPTEAQSVIRLQAQSVNAPLIEVGASWQYQVLTTTQTGQQVLITQGERQWQVLTNMLGEHQAHNLTVALAALDSADIPVILEAEQINRGAQAIRWPGRLEIAQMHPLTIIDSAHTAESAQVLFDAVLTYFAQEAPRTLIYASKSKKDIRQILRILAPAFDQIIVTQVINPPTETIEHILQAIQVEPFANKVIGAPDIHQALPAVDQRSQLICIAGSVYLAGEARETLGLKSE